MKAATYIKNIKESGKCSIHTAELLTNALHREGLLRSDLSVRFRPLFGDFDIVDTAFLNGKKKESEYYILIGKSDYIIAACLLASKGELKNDR